MPDETTQLTNTSASNTTLQPQTGGAPLQPQTGGLPPPTSSPSKYEPNTRLAGILLAAALVVIFGTGIYLMIWHTSPGYTGGGAAATAGILLLLALVLQFPTLITD